MSSSPRSGEALRCARWVAPVLVAVALVSSAGVGLRLGRDGSPIASPPGAISAAASASAARPLFRLAVAGDVGTGDAEERRTARAAAARGGSRGWDALVLLGDNVYDDGDPSRVGSTVLQPFRDVLRPGVPLLAALGNHDVDTGHGPAQLRALGQPGPWYARRFGSLQIVVLDSNRPDDPAQLDWLRRTLAADTATFTVAVMHHPMRSAGTHGSDLRVRAAFGPLFQRYAVPLVLAGHDHDYQRTRAIAGTTYLVSGAAAKLRPAGHDEDTVVSMSRRHFLDLAVYADRLVVQAVAQDGSVLDGLVLPAT